MLSEKYSEAAVDVLDILDHMIDEDVQKVPKKFISILEECASKEYVANLDYSKRLVEMNLSGEAQGILGVMYRHYWCPIEKKEEFENKITENEIEFQKALREKYNPDEIFKSSKSSESSKSNLSEKSSEPESSLESENSLTEVKEESLFRRIINKIISVFKRN